MDITALSTALQMSQLNFDVGVAVLDNSLELIEDLGEGMIKIMESSVNPNLGQNIDISI